MRQVVITSKKSEYIFQSLDFSTMKIDWVLYISFTFSLDKQKCIPSLDVAIMPMLNSKLNMWAGVPLFKKKQTQIFQKGGVTLENNWHVDGKRR